MTDYVRTVAEIVDHTLLKPETTGADVAALAVEGRELGVYSVCISPSKLPFDTGGLRIAAVCGFPSGAHASEIKAQEAALAVKNGASEIDMVINLGLVKDSRWEEVETDIQAVRNAAPEPIILKVIIESAALTDDEIVKACQASEAAGADFVKTSTGFHPTGGASTHAVELMAATVSGRLGVKASGGIRTGADALAMIGAGATRLGLSGTAQVLADLAGDGPSSDNDNLGGGSGESTTNPGY